MSHSLHNIIKQALAKRRYPHSKKILQCGRQSIEEKNNNEPAFYVMGNVSEYYRQLLIPQLKPAYAS